MQGRYPQQQDDSGPGWGTALGGAAAIGAALTPWGRAAGNKIGGGLRSAVQGARNGAYVTPGSAVHGALGAVDEGMARVGQYGSDAGALGQDLGKAANAISEMPGQAARTIRDVGAAAGVPIQDALAARLFARAESKAASGAKLTADEKAANLLKQNGIDAQTVQGSNAKQLIGLMRDAKAAKTPEAQQVSAAALDAWKQNHQAQAAGVDAALADFVADTTKNAWSTGAKAAAGVAGVGTVAGAGYGMNELMQ
ncbi:hypothetical protein [Chromatium okenii]|uniref:hypothetical protein n=1 Tax=Chromatium okenii TaxID=61644 RepID=UPI0026EF2225|nr:hypothetical protein [Chromatium okenii]MBV5310888.1 hypothetical protein [Chromatium okenii]